MPAITFADEKEAAPVKAYTLPMFNFAGKSGLFHREKSFIFLKINVRKTFAGVILRREK